MPLCPHFLCQNSGHMVTANWNGHRKIGFSWVLVSASGPKLLKLSLSFNFLTCKMGRINNTTPVRLCSEIHFKYLRLFCPFLSFLALPPKPPHMHTHVSKLTNRLYLLA